jgi:hypothetical protein
LEVDLRLDRDFVRFRDFVRGFDFDRFLDFVRFLDFDRGFDFDRFLDFDCGLDRFRDFDFDRFRDFVLDLEVDLRLDRGFDFVRFRFLFLPSFASLSSLRLGGGPRTGKSRVSSFFFFFVDFFRFFLGVAGVTINVTPSFSILIPSSISMSCVSFDSSSLLFVGSGRLSSGNFFDSVCSSSSMTTLTRGSSGLLKSSILSRSRLSRSRSRSRDRYGSSL